MRQKPAAELKECFGHAVPQVSQNAFAGLHCLCAPAFDDAAAWFAVGARKAAGVCREPKCGEIRIELFCKDEIEVRLNVRRTGHAGVISEQAQFGAIGDNSPQATIVRVEVLLHQGMRSLSAPVFRERVGSAVEIMAIMRE